MIISLQKNFIFIAGLKVASTSMDFALRNFADIHLVTTFGNRHADINTAAAILNTLSVPKEAETFCKFSVIREPTDFIYSLYRSHKKNAFKNHPASTLNSSFNEFWEEWIGRDDWVLWPQVNRLKNADGSIGVDYILRYHDLQKDFQNLCRQLNLGDLSLKNYNSSIILDNRELLSPQNLKEVQVVFKSDYEIIHSDRFCI